MRPLRLVVFGPGHPYRGGIAVTTTELVQALVARDVAVEFLTPLRQYPRFLYPGGDDRDPRACPRLECARQCLDPLSPRSWSRARREALGVGSDAWVIPYWTWAWAGLWSFLLHGRRPPAVAVVHNPADHDAGAMQRLAARLVLSRCQALFTHGEVLAAGLRESHPGVPVASHPLPAASLGTRPSRDAARKTLGIAERARLLVFFGLIRPYKGLDILLGAVSRLPRESGWELVVAGEPWGDLGAELGQRVKDSGIADRVRLDLRWLADEEASTLLAAADAVVLPYRTGSQSAVAPLALAYGVPVISTRVGSLPEVVIDGVNGVLVPPGSVEALAEALACLDDTRLDGLAEGARASAARLGWPAYAAALEELIQRVV